MPELTILTVCMEKHFSYVRQQLDLVEALNPGAAWRLLVVDNSRTGEPALRVDDGRCEVIAGVAPPKGLPGNYMASYHHGEALNLAMSKVDTRYAVVIDPDLFVLYRNWISELADYCRIRDLSMFGVPWHYRWYTKYRYYPAVHFLFIDREKLDTSGLDFTPSIEDTRPPWFWRQFRKTPWLAVRGRINVSRDTGWRLGHEVRRAGRRAEVALPVVDLDKELTKPAFLQSEWGRWVERRLPASLSLLPRRGAYLAPRQAPGFMTPTMAALKAEMFVWRGAPFAFHLRRHVRDTVQGGTDRPSEDAVIAGLLREVRRSTIWPDWAWPGEPAATGSAAA